MSNRTDRYPPFTASPADQCDIPGCDQTSVALVANDEPLLSSDYLERQVCRWHVANPFPTEEATQ
ncbi:hypothetical protein [Phycicoccus avicenniae]|uniref:hypothetical protein n=1 Tax=Phycicoccus avicenniae TaxID=2828860 RepID=UPI003D27C8FE